MNDRRLYRSRDDRMLFGVAGGMAKYFDQDPALVRLVWAVLILAAGVGLLLYIIAAIVVPEEPLGAVAEGGAATAGSPGGGSAGPGGASARPRSGSGGGAVVLGVILVVIGAWFLLRRVVPELDTGLLWPILLVGLGAALLLGAMRRT